MCVTCYIYIYIYIYIYGVKQEEIRDIFSIKKKGVKHVTYLT
ncbi:MAG: hypothetical protein N7Q72_07155 [Spiroplasma sp. Tabriz.8]|nr:hypothetical protein [Spiroplasma sp. Tabriz.8]